MQSSWATSTSCPSPVRSLCLRAARMPTTAQIAGSRSPWYSAGLMGGPSGSTRSPVSRIQPDMASATGAKLGRSL